MTPSSWSAAFFGIIAGLPWTVVHLAFGPNKISPKIVSVLTTLMVWIFSSILVSGLWKKHSFPDHRLKDLKKLFFSGAVGLAGGNLAIYFFWMITTWGMQDSGRLEAISIIGAIYAVQVLGGSVLGVITWFIASRFHIRSRGS